MTTSSLGLIRAGGRFRRIRGTGEARPTRRDRRSGRSARRSFVAHRDYAGVGGERDNASGTAALVELARAYSSTRLAVGGVSPTHTLSFVSTDAGAYRLARRAEARAKLPASRPRRGGIVLEFHRIASPPRLEIAGDGPRSPSPGLVATAERLAEQTGSAAEVPSALARLVDLAFPFSLTEQYPFLAEHIPGADGDHGRQPRRRATSPAAARPVVLGRVGRAAEGLLASLDASLEPAGDECVPLRRRRGGPRLGDRLLYVALLVPFVVCLPRSRRPAATVGVPTTPALRGYLPPARLLALHRRGLHALRRHRTLARRRRSGDQPCI